MRDKMLDLALRVAAVAVNALSQRFPPLRSPAVLYRAQDPCVIPDLPHWYGCPHDPICAGCPAAGHEDVCLPAERYIYEQSLNHRKPT
jgi:hypothetical protein